MLPEMEELLPPLNAEQFSSLESDILESGRYAPVIVNEDMTVIDGYNRLCICEKHGPPYKMLVFLFADLLEAKQWTLDTQKGHRNLNKWELGQIALRLKPEIEARAKTNQLATGGSKSSKGAFSVNPPRALQPVDTREELARAVGVGKQTMGRIVQLAENASQSLKNALEDKELSINRGWRVLKVVQQLPLEERESAAAEILSTVREIDQLNAEAKRRGKITGLFCKAYEKAVLLTLIEENMRIWAECTRMTQEETADSVQESYELVQTSQTTGDLLKNVTSRVYQWSDTLSDQGQN